MNKLKEKLKNLKSIMISFVNKNKKLVLIFTIILVLPVVLLIFTTFSPTNRNLKKLNSLAKEIEISNSNLNAAINENSINPEISKEVLTSNLVELERIKNEISTLDLSNLDKTQKALLQFVDININLYKISLDLYSNPKTDKLTKKIESYNTTLDLFLQEAYNLQKLGIVSMVSDNTVNFFKFTKNYFNTINEMNMLSDIQGKIKRSFLASLSSITSKFSKINEDLSPAIKDIYSNGRSTETLLSNINDNKDTLDKIKKEYFDLSIPEDAFTLQDSLANLINLYDIYINELELAINSNSKEKLENAYSKFEDFNNLYLNFLKDLEEYKYN